MWPPVRQGRGEATGRNGQRRGWQGTVKILRGRQKGKGRRDPTETVGHPSESGQQWRVTPRCKRSPMAHSRSNVEAKKTPPGKQTACCACNTWRSTLKKVGVAVELGGCERLIPAREAVRTRRLQ